MNINLNFKNKKGDYFAIILIILSVSAMYYKTLGDFFIFDDIRWIQEGLKIEKDVRNFFRPLHWGYYRPLPALIFLLQYKIFGLEPFYYYLTNLLLHIGNSILSYYLVILLFEKYIKERIKIFAFFTSFFFAISFARFEPVVCLGMSNDLLVYLFFFLSLIFFIRNGNILFFIISIFSYILGLFSKESIITLPAILFITEVVIFKSKVSISIKKVIPYIVVSVCYLIFFYLIAIAPGVLKEAYDNRYHFGTHSIFVFLKYFLGLVFSSFGFEKLNLANFIILLAALIIMWLSIRKGHSKIITYSLIWIIVTFLPYVFYEGEWKNIILFGHRFLYIPSFGFLILLGYVVFLEFKEKHSFKSLNRIGVIIFITFIIFNNITTISKKQLAVREDREKVRILLMGISHIVNLYPYKTLVILDFPKTPELIYRRDILDFLYLKGLGDFRSWFTTTEELSKYKFFYDVESVIFVEYKQGIFFDRTNNYHKLLSCSLESVP